MKLDLKMADPAMKIYEITFSPTGGVNKTADLLADCLNGEKNIYRLSRQTLP